MVHRFTTRLTLAALLLSCSAWHANTRTNDDLLGTMFGSQTGASMLLFTALKAIKKTASAQELEDVKSELRRAEKGALTYGIINLLTSLTSTNTDAVLPVDAVQDSAGFTSTYWLVRKIASQLLDTELGNTLINQSVIVDYIPEGYQKLIKQVVMGAITNFVYNWTKGIIA